MHRISAYGQYLEAEILSIYHDEAPEKGERAWKIVENQQNRHDVFLAARIFYKFFPNCVKIRSIKFTDGLKEFGISQIECFKKESPALERMLNEGNVALSSIDFCAALNSDVSTFESAYYLNISRLIRKRESEILEKVNHWINTANYQAGFELLNSIRASHLKNTPFLQKLIENELADLFGRAWLLKVSDEEKLNQIAALYQLNSITAITLSFETERARKALRYIATIDSLKKVKIDCFSLRDGEISFPKQITEVELINTIELTAETLKTVPVTLIKLTFRGTHFTANDLRHLPNTIQHLHLDSLFWCKAEEDIFLHFPNLETLIIKNSPSISGKALLALPHKLAYIEMAGSNITDEDLTKLPDSLQTLLIPNSSITNAARFPNPLRKLDVSGTKISDEGVSYMPENLTYLALNECEIEGAALKRLQALTHLYMRGCPFKPEFIGEIPSSVTHLCMDAEIGDEEAQLLPKRIVVCSINGAALSERGLLRLARTLTEIEIFGFKLILEVAKMHLPEGCVIKGF